MEEYQIDKKHVKELLREANEFIKNHSHDGGQILSDIKHYSEMLSDSNSNNEKKHIACVLLENYLSVAKAFDEGVNFCRK